MIPTLPARRLAASLLILLAAAGCDSGDSLTLDADYYVGTWDLVRLADQSGDRTAEVLAFVDEFSVAFRSDGTFTLAADFKPAVNAAGQADVSFSGTYQATATQLVLRPTGLPLAPSLAAEAQSQSRVDLTGSNVVVSQLLGANLPVRFSGDVVLGIDRR